MIEIMFLLLGRDPGPELVEWAIRVQNAGFTIEQLWDDGDADCGGDGPHYLYTIRKNGQMVCEFSDEEIGTAQNSDRVKLERALCEESAEFEELCRLASWY